MSNKATIKNVFDLLRNIKHIFDKKPKILDNHQIFPVILFVLEQMFEERAEMSAQIIEFPMDRIRQAKPVASGRRVQTYVQPVRPSVRIARKVIASTVVLVTAYLFFFGQASSIEPAGASDTAVSTQTTKNFTYVTVQSGDSLWSIAERNSNGGDVRDFIQEIIALNNLTDSVVSAGMQLAIPRS